MHRSEFLELLKRRLPELRIAVNRQEGLLHFEVGELRKHAQRAIYDEDRVLLAICFRLAEEGYAKGDKELQNAIDTSFVEELEFKTPHNSYPWAWEMMPSVLKRLYLEFHGDQRIPP